MKKLKQVTSMIELEDVRIKSRDGYNLSLLVHETKGAGACVQIIHGMAEHSGRYIDFAGYLAENGFSVVMSDLRGHGKDAPMLSHISDDKGDELLITDQQMITDYINDRFRGLPVYIFAHSMGTIISRVLLQTDSNRYDKAVFSGYVCPIPLSGMACGISCLSRAFKKPRGHSRFLTFLALGPYIMSVKDRKTPHDWLTYERSNVENYINDPLSGVEFTIGSYNALFRLSNKMGKAGEYKNVNKDLNFLLLSGRDDPCAGGDKGRRNSRKVLEDAGFKNISVITYDGMRHEILNEADKNRVYRDVLDFLNKN